MSWKEQRHMRQFAKQTALDIKASASGFSEPVNHIMANYGQVGTMKPGRNFPESHKADSRKPFPSVMLHPESEAVGCQEFIMSNACLSSSTKKVTFLLTLWKKGLPGRPLRPRPSLSQHQPLIPVNVIWSARMSETAPILDTDLQPLTMDNVILTLVTTRRYAYPPSPQ